MKIGIAPGQRFYELGMGVCGDVVRHAEQLGFDAIWVTDHVAPCEQLPGTYPYRADGSAPFGPGAPWHDPFVLMSFLAAATTRMRIGTSVLVLPLRHPVLTAKAAATLDSLSGGRLVLGVGTGWLRDEFDALGQSFENRAATTVEAVGLLRRLWAEAAVSHDGESYSFRGVTSDPKPSTGRRIPIYFGGESEAALKRAADLGDGWINVSTSFEATKLRIERLHALRHLYGRATTPFEFVVRVPSDLESGAIRDYAGLGVDHLWLTPWVDDTSPRTISSMKQTLDQCAERFISAHHN